MMSMDWFDERESKEKNKVEYPSPRFRRGALRFPVISFQVISQEYLNCCFSIYEGETKFRFSGNIAQIFTDTLWISFRQNNLSESLTCRVNYSTRKTIAVCGLIIFSRRKFFRFLREHHPSIFAAGGCFARNISAWYINSRLFVMYNLRTSVSRMSISR